MANRYFTATTCNDSTSITFITDDLIITANPINRIYQVNDGRCITISSSGLTTTNDSTLTLSYGPYTSCTQCITPANSAGITSINCTSCDSVESVTATTVPHAIYVNSQNRAISQNNTVSIGGFNGLNN
jgi:hypothetical protein